MTLVLFLVSRNSKSSLMLVLSGSAYMFSQEPPLLVDWSPYGKNRCPYPLSSGGAKKLQVTTSLGKRGLRRQTLRSVLLSLTFGLSHWCYAASAFTSLKPSSWVVAGFVVFDWPARVLAFSTPFNSCRATVYVLYRALNRVFPVWALQKFCPLSSAVLTIDVTVTHRSWRLPATSSMSQSILNSCFRCVSASGNCPISRRYSTLTSYVYLSKMPDTPALGCQPSLGKTLLS